MPTYDNTTPAAAQQINASQPIIQTNFDSIQTAFEVNHIDITGAVPATNCGKHKYVQLPEQGAAPGTAINEGAVFSREGAETQKTELCFQRENGGNVFEMTGGLLANPGWTRLPSGILLKWGFGACTTSSEINTIIFPPAGTIPVFAHIYSIQLTGEKLPGYNSFGSVIDKTILQFRWLSFGVAGIAFTINYLAIGD